MIDPELRPFLLTWREAWSGVSSDAPVAVRRAVLERITEQAREPLPLDLESTVATVAGGPRPVRVRLFRPAAGPPTPALVFMHGGAWMLGSPETHYHLAAEIARKTRQVVISVDYALAPEHPFPAAVEDCQAVVRWAFAEASTLNVRPDAISIGGESSGANLAAAMTLCFRKTPHRFKGQLLFYPPVDFTHDRASFVENAEGPVLTTAGIVRAMETYLPNLADRRDPLAAPLRAADHTGLPPAFVAVAEHDPLRDDGIAYAERLLASGVPVQLDLGDGLIHGYLRALPHAASARATLDLACAWLRKVAGDQTVTSAGGSCVDT